MLGLGPDDSKISLSMITTTETLTGFEILNMMGTVEGIAEESFGALQVGNVGFHKGGGLEGLVLRAKDQLARAASDRGADAVIAFRYEVMGRDLEKSVIAYGTAVRCRKNTAK